MPARPVHTEEQVLAAIQKESGLISKAAKRLKCDRDTVHNYADQYPAVRAMIDQYRASLKRDREALLDLCEAELHKRVEQGDERALYYALNKLGYGRGYGEPRQATLPEGYAVSSFTVTVVRREQNELVEVAKVLSSRATPLPPSKGDD